MENNIENKYSFFAQYWNVEAHKMIAKPNLYKVGRNGLFVGEFDYLVLKPLSSITDEDAYNYAKNYLNWTDPDDYKKWFLDQGFQIKGHRHADYLRSKGYAVSWMGLTIEEMIDYGWIKLKSE